jgi:hypothetical protein
MTPSAWIAASIGACGLVLNLAAFLIGYGVLKGTVSALLIRVVALEAETSALSELKVTVAEVRTTLTFLLEQFKDLNSSIRWMREPAGPEPVRGAAPRVRAPK